MSEPHFIEGQTVSYYRILHKLGGGEKGVGEDTQL
jgi:hypothetical protein